MYCKKCGNEIQDVSDFCSYCGTKLKDDVPNSKDDLDNNTAEHNKNKTADRPAGCLSVFVFIIVVFIIVPLIINDNKIPNINIDELANTMRKDGSLEVVEHHQCTMKFGTRAICGTIKNNSSHNKSYIAVSINLYDKNGDLIDTTLDNVNDLAPGEQWKFQAPILETSGISSYKITDVTGF